MKKTGSSDPVFFYLNNFHRKDAKYFIYRRGAETQRKLELFAIMHNEIGKPLYRPYGLSLSKTEKNFCASAEYVVTDSIVGVGTGSTVNHFIDLLADIKGRIEGAVSSSEASTERMKKHGIRVYDLNEVNELPVYIDGADESDHYLNLIKGGGGALTREKIIAGAADKFVCIADETKLVDVLGTFPLPVEVIPMARGYIARELVKLGGRPVWRDNFITDNGNIILDVHDFEIMEPIRMENEINKLAGVVTVGIFANRPADVLILGTPEGARTVYSK